MVIKNIWYGWYFLWNGENAPLSMQMNSFIVLKIIQWENKLESQKEGVSNWQYSEEKCNTSGEALGRLMLLSVKMQRG